MAGGGRKRRRAIDDGRRCFPEFPSEQPFNHVPVPRPSHPAAAELEEELELRDQEISELMSENHSLVEDRMSLQRELVAAKEELRHMNKAIKDIRAEREAHSRDLFERGLKLVADLRATEPLRNEAAKLRSEIQRLNAQRQELAGKIQSLTEEVARAKADNQKIPFFKSKIDDLRQELMQSRDAIDYERKGNAGLLEQRHDMERNFASMSRELEKLRADLGSIESRPWAADSGSAGVRPLASDAAYGMKQCSPDGVALLSSYGDVYYDPALCDAAGRTLSYAMGPGLQSGAGPGNPDIWRR